MKYIIVNSLNNKKLINLAHEFIQCNQNEPLCFFNLIKGKRTGKIVYLMIKNKNSNLSIDLGVEALRINMNFNGKGGGSNDFVQGCIKYSKENILKIIDYCPNPIILD